MSGRGEEGRGWECMCVCACVCVYCVADCLCVRVVGCGVV